MRTKEQTIADAERRRQQYEAVAHLHLLPCPFCGHDARLTLFTDYWIVECCNFDLCNAYGPNKDAPNDAATAWNWRRRESALRGALVALVGADTPEELQAMAAMMRVVPAPEEDKAAMANAILVLLSGGG